MCVCVCVAHVLEYVYPLEPLTYCGNPEEGEHIPALGVMVYLGWDLSGAFGTWRGVPQAGVCAHVDLCLSLQGAFPWRLLPDQRSRHWGGRAFL